MYASMYAMYIWYGVYVFYSVSTNHTIPHTHTNPRKLRKNLFNKSLTEI